MLRVFCMTILMSLSAVAFADTKLNGDQVKQLISGNSVDGHSNAQGVDFKAYFAPDGSGTLQNEKGRKFNGVWRITESGDHCSKWGDRKETCGQIMDAGDGSYKRMEEGYPRSIWKKIHPGNAFQL